MFSQDASIKSQSTLSTSANRLCNASITMSLFGVVMITPCIPFPDRLIVCITAYLRRHITTIVIAGNHVLICSASMPKLYLRLFPTERTTQYIFILCHDLFSLQINLLLLVNFLLI